MEQLNQRAEIIDFPQENLVRVRINSISACQGCSGCGILKPTSDQEFLVDCPSSHNFKIGDMVSVNTNVSSFMLSLFFLCILPTITLIGGLFLAPPQYQLLGAVLGLAMGVIISILVDRLGGIVKRPTITGSSFE